MHICIYYIKRSEVETEYYYLLYILKRYFWFYCDLFYKYIYIFNVVKTMFYFKYLSTFLNALELRSQP